MWEDGIVLPKGNGEDTGGFRLHSPEQRGLPGGSEGKESAYNAGDLNLIPGSGRPPRKEDGNPLQYAGLENPRDRGTWWAIVHVAEKSWT